MQLTIITIGRNNAEGYKRTLASVASQTTKMFEMVVIDGNSTDDSVNVIKQYATRIETLHWISEPDKGIYDAMNKGIACATGEYLLFLNSGDILASDTVIEEWLKNDNRADIISCNAIFEKSQFHDEKYIISPNIITAEHLVLSFLPHQATFIRRQLFIDIHPYDTSFKVVSDWLFFIEAILVYNATYQHLQMFVARCETEGISSNPENCKLMDDEFQQGLQKVLPLYYSTFLELRNVRKNKNTDKHKFVLKFSQSKLMWLIWKMRKRLEKLGYYKVKTIIKTRVFYRQLQREDDAKKHDIARKIESLPIDILSCNNDESDIIVSLTSYGKRVADTAPYAIYSLFVQSHLPNRIVLWLDEDNWNDDNLPYLLKRLKKSGLEIYYCEDIRSYKKLLPSLKKFPDNHIVVIDDDFYYHKDFVQWMVDAFAQSDGHTVFATWGCIPQRVGGKYIPYSQWKDCKYGNANSEYSLFGGGGGYPPQIFDDEIFRKDLYMTLCPTADDIWFWAQEKRLGIKTKLTPTHGFGLHEPVNRIEQYDIHQKGTLFYQNGIQGKNDQQLRSVIDYYNLD